MTGYARESEITETANQVVSYYWADRSNDIKFSDNMREAQRELIVKYQPTMQEADRKRAAVTLAHLNGKTRFAWRAPTALHQEIRAARKRQAKTSTLQPATRAIVK